MLTGLSKSIELFGWLSGVARTQDTYGTGGGCNGGKATIRLVVEKELGIFSDIVNGLELPATGTLLGS